jgi:hypothetical protein
VKEQVALATRVVLIDDEPTLGCRWRTRRTSSHGLGNLSLSRPGSHFLSFSLYRVKIQGNTVWGLILAPLPLLGRESSQGLRRVGSRLPTVAQAVRKQQEADAEDLLVRTLEPGVDVVRSLVAGRPGVQRLFQERAQRRR